MACLGSHFPFPHELTPEELSDLLGGRQQGWFRNPGLLTRYLAWLTWLPWSERCLLGLLTEISQGPLLGF